MELDKGMIILNENIGHKELSRRGLHLNGRGTGRLAMNFLAHIRGQN